MHKLSHKMISDITDSILDELNDWRNRPLKKCYTFVFVDCLYVTLRHDYERAVRKLMYTTYAIETINSSLRKVTKNEAFFNENALLINATLNMYIHMLTVILSMVRGEVSTKKPDMYYPVLCYILSVVKLFCIIKI